MEALLLPIINAHLPPAMDQHGFRPKHATTSALLQLTTDIATGFNQKKPPHRTVSVAVDLTAAFDTVTNTVLISKIGRSTLPEATCRWLSNYIRGRQPVTSCRGVKSKARIVHAGVPQGSKLLLLLSTHSSLIIGGSPLLLSDGGSPPASPASLLAGLLRRRDPSTNPGPIAWWVSVGN